MKLIIDISEEVREHIFDLVDNGNEIPLGINAHMIKAIVNGKSIPDNATNGDMIKVLFPNCDYLEFIHDINVYPDKTKQKVVGNFDRDWWNAPYKAESEG